MKKNDFTTFVDDDGPEEATASSPPVSPLGRRIFNHFPVVDNPSYRIAIIGDCPDRDSELQGIPFVGQSGKLLNGMLSRCRILQEACFTGHLCQYHPPGGDINYFPWSGTIIQEGLTQLRADLEKYHPNICLLLGRAPLQTARPGSVLQNWRGSLFIGQGPFAGFKCIATYHPTRILANFSWSCYLQQDILKCLTQATTHDLHLPHRNLYTDLPCDSVISLLDSARHAQSPVALDIEGYWHSLSCCSVATSPSDSFIVPFSNLDGTSYWPLEQEWMVWKAFIALLEDPEVPKIFQNGLYDRFVLQYGYGIVVRGNADDTMLKFWEWRCEMKKRLGVQASILTNEPYWKDERKGKEDEVEGH